MSTVAAAIRIENDGESWFAKEAFLLQSLLKSFTFHPTWKNQYNLCVMCYEQWESEYWIKYKFCIWLFSSYPKEAIYGLDQSGLVFAVSGLSDSCRHKIFNSHLTKGNQMATMSHSQLVKMLCKQWSRFG